MWNLSAEFETGGESGQYDADTALHRVKELIEQDATAIVLTNGAAESEPTFSD